MVKGIEAEDILQGLPVEQRPELVKRLKSEGGVGIRLTARRKRKWFVKGKVVGVRLPDTVYGRITALAGKEELTVSEWCKANLIRAAGLLPDGSVRSRPDRESKRANFFRFFRFFFRFFRFFFRFFFLLFFFFSLFFREPGTG